MLFLFDRDAVMSAVKAELERTFPDAALHSLETDPELKLDDVLPAPGLVTASTGFIVIVRGPAVPEIDELTAFVRASEKRLAAHERMAVAVPVLSNDAALFTKTAASSLPEQRSFLTHYSGEPILAVKTAVLQFVPPAERRLASVDWAAFARSANAFGFSVERVPVAVRASGRHAKNPRELPDLATFLALSLETADGTCALDLSRLPVSYNGSIEYSLGVCGALVRRQREGRRWVVIAERAVAEAFRLQEWNVELVEPPAVDRVFDLVFVPHQIYSVAHLQFLSAIAARYAFCVLDVIALRCDYIREQREEKWTACTAAAEYADALVSLSRTDASDVEAFLESEGIHVHVDPVLITKDITIGAVRDEAPYFLVLGNAFRHKAIEPFLQAVLANPPRVRLRVVADRKIEQRFAGHPSIEVMVSGTVPEERMEALYGGAAAVVFPSLYEGFGLPVAGGLLRGKPVVAIDNAMNRELMAAFDSGGLLSLLPSHAAMAAALHSIDVSARRAPPDPARVRTWAEVAAETDAVLTRTLERPVDWPRVYARQRQVRRLAGLEAGQGVEHLPLRQLGAVVLRRTLSAVRRRVRAKLT